VATDVAARGIHVKRLRYVVNYDFPTNLEQYCHRVGRTGRQGETGSAYSLVTRNMAPLAGDLIALLRSSGVEPEPNLLALASEFSSGTFVMDADDNEAQGDDEDEK
jgi:ATP-dependent RNA helicase DDX5/DBP2